jgi:hypothetical protein
MELVINLPVSSPLPSPYGTLSFNVRKLHKLRASENKVAKKVSGTRERER